MGKEQIDKLYDEVQAKLNNARRAQAYNISVQRETLARLEKVQEDFRGQVEAAQIKLEKINRDISPKAWQKQFDRVKQLNESMTLAEENVSLYQVNLIDVGA